MALRTPRVFLLAVVNLLSAACAAAQSDPAERAEFRIENRVFVDNEKEPHSESTTVFFRGIVYDYLKKPAEATVFDKPRGRFILLDMTRRVHTEVTMEKVAAFADALRQWAASQSDPFVQFLGDPRFDEQVDEGSRQLAFDSPWMQYHLTAVDTEDAAISRAYREFSDWHCRLNTLLTPGARPPFPRMAVNAALEKRQLFPSEAHLVIHPKKGLAPKRMSIRSEHQLIRRLVESDRDRVAQTDQFMAIFRRVSFEEYQGKIAN